ncbi:MAG TPA: amidohydrolase family protein [Blastocatellia bacterium]|nr:amidohydrolase family protein [Blastocatellia bacterium]
MIVDSHQHFWNYDAAEYGWIDDAMKAIRRDFLPHHLAEEIAAAGVDGVISVQARQTLEETEWLLDLAERHKFIKGVVGWVDLLSPGAAELLERLAANPKLKGVRHIVQAEPDDEFILRDDFNRGVSALARFGLRYDILIFERHLRATSQFVERHPDQIVILDHIAKPSIKTNQLSPWRENIKNVARRPNVYCKVSGMVTEAEFRTWTEAQLRPYFEVVLEAFGPQRLMFGSDWPVCLVACDYSRWQRIVLDWIGDLSKDEQARILGGTAVEAYKL